MRDPLLPQGLPARATSSPTGTTWFIAAAGSDAIERLHSTNNFPEFTGRVCPAPCEEACVLNINNDPVTIKLIEKNIIDHAFAEGWVKPVGAQRRTGKNVAVVGSGPSGLACAQQLARAGHAVTLFERSDRVGGLLMYGIPDFKLEKASVDRRVEQMKAEGVEFETNCHVGVDYPGGPTARGVRRHLPDDRRDQAARPAGPGTRAGAESISRWSSCRCRTSATPATLSPKAGSISAKGKRVVILGGGDTGSDCLGTSESPGRSSRCISSSCSPKPPDAAHRRHAVAELADDPAHLHLA